VNITYGPRLRFWYLVRFSIFNPNDDDDVTKILPETMDVENNTDGVISKIVLELNEQGKRPLQTSEEDGECKQNKRKINDEDNDDEPAMSKKKLKKIQKQQKWLEKKTKRK